MTAKEYLGQARFLDMRINSKIQQIASLNELATRCTATISDMPKSPNRGGSRMADAVIKIIDLQEEINRDINKLVELKREITEFGFLAKHPTTGNAIQSPYVAMSQNFMSQTNRLWMEIYQIVKENCAGEYAGATPQDDAMERLLLARKGH